ncbi:MAG: ATP-binding cassette domain-containing protein [Pseudomonadota bacterium]
MIKGRGGLINEPSLPASVYFGSAIINILGLGLPLTILHIYDRVLPNQAFNTLTILVLGLIGVTILDTILRMARGSIMSWHAASFAHRQSMDAMARLMSANSSKVSGVRASSIMTQLRSLSELADFHGSSSRLLLIDIACIPLFGVVMVVIAGPLIAVQIFLLIGFFAYIMSRTNRLRGIIETKEGFEDRKYDFILETLQTMQTVKSHAMESLLMRRFERLQSSSSQELRQNVLASQSIAEIGGLFAMLMTTGVVFFGALMVIADNLTIGALAACMLLSSQMMQPIMRSIQSWNMTIQTAHKRAEVTQLYEQLGDQEPSFEQAVRREGHFAPGRIEIENVAVQFENNPAVFQNINMTVEPGEFVGLKGADGSGRSLLMKCITGEISPSQGHVRIDGHTPELKQADISYVGQVPQLFHGSILDNLTLFGTYTAHEARWIADISGLSEEINRLPDGFDTQLLGTTSPELSAAFSQLICVARAIVSKPSILLLDDANSGLDARTEAVFMQMLTKLSGDITIIMATQRPSILRIADTVYELAGRTVRLTGSQVPPPAIDTLQERAS